MQRRHSYLMTRRLMNWLASPGCLLFPRVVILSVRLHIKHSITQKKYFYWDRGFDVLYLHKEKVQALKHVAVSPLSRLILIGQEWTSCADTRPRMSIFPRFVTVPSLRPSPTEL
jgi:hypothetical protein